MNNFTIVIFVLFVAVWIYSIISIYTSEFEEEKAKIFWRIGIIFVPFLALFYLFMKKNLLKQ
ncbi:MAG: PLDc N-terminal domain-containing protein [Sulfurimonas sp.]|uniref:PLDc N-terminal domain-containing protein n=1 Tax=Sulfurimonas sp. TaxID=2022749 RepID=UPI002621874F|nr:PLDc N-terminal domain-containing protein [Sulfurimonas sp.]MCW8895918.1 PLDc N-terminal domain-containing protein [Sulfurimonas sp.]MCW8954482.1 PLDc N-terminal domain-containing protein [Sulfurimonas sp.]MCW9067890.1 PLDc N-terminal domain-containing protein [Sulfurimonas sp.]